MMSILTLHSSSSYLDCCLSSLIASSSSAHASSCRWWSSSSFCSSDHWARVGEPSASLSILSSMPVSLNSASTCRLIYIVKRCLNRQIESKDFFAVQTLRHCCIVTKQHTRIKIEQFSSTIYKYLRDPALLRVRSVRGILPWILLLMWWVGRKVDNLEHEENHCHRGLGGPSLLLPAPTLNSSQQIGVSPACKRCK